MKDVRDLLEEQSITFLVFSVCGVRFAAEASQIAVINLELMDCKKPFIIKLNDILGLDVKQHAVEYTALELKATDTDECTVIMVDTLDDMLEIQISSINLFPLLIREHALRHGMWGIVDHLGNTIILMDFNYIRGNRDASGLELQQAM